MINTPNQIVGTYQIAAFSIFRIVIILDITFPYPIKGELCEQHLVVSQPHGGGSKSYQVTINDFFVGQIVRYNTGWKSFVKSDALTQDDIDAIIDIIESQTHD